MLLCVVKVVGYVVGRLAVALPFVWVRLVINDIVVATLVTNVDHDGFLVFAIFIGRPCMFLIDNADF